MHKRRHGLWTRSASCRISYSAGFSLLDPPSPETILFGLPVGTAGKVINAVFERVRSGIATLRPGAVVAGFPDIGPDLRFRVDEVLPQWVVAYARLAGSLLDGAEIPSYVQLVWADRHGRWPEETRNGACVPQHQPLLAHDPAWRVPVEHTADEDMFLDHAVGADLVAMPVFDYDVPGGRFEVLSCERLDEDRVRIGQVPWLADYVAYGDIVSVRPKLPGEHDAGLDGALMGGALLAPGGCHTLAYDLAGGPARSGVELGDVLDGLTADPRDARASTSSDTLHLNTRQPEAARSAMRRFVRDGYVVEVSLRSDGPSVAPSLDGSCCTPPGSSKA